MHNSRFQIHQKSQKQQQKTPKTEVIILFISLSLEKVEGRTGAVSQDFGSKILRLYEL